MFAITSNTTTSAGTVLNSTEVGAAPPQAPLVAKDRIDFADASAQGGFVTVNDLHIKLLKLSLLLAQMDSLQRVSDRDELRTKLQCLIELALAKAEEMREASLKRFIGTFVQCLLDIVSAGTELARSTKLMVEVQQTFKAHRDARTVSEGASAQADAAGKKLTDAQSELKAAQEHMDACTNPLDKGNAATRLESAQRVRDEASADFASAKADAAAKAKLAVDPKEKWDLVSNKLPTAQGKVAATGALIKATGQGIDGGLRYAADQSDVEAQLIEAMIKFHESTQQATQSDLQNISKFIDDIFQLCEGVMNKDYQLAISIG